MKIMITIAMITIALVGCAPSIQSTVMPGVKFSDYKTAYIQPVPQDDFNMTGSIAGHLSKMGYCVIAKNKPDVPTATDLLVSFNYYGWWDFGMGLTGRC
jgi:hypothetical protein